MKFVVKMNQIINDGTFGDTMEVELTGIEHMTRDSALMEIEQHEALIAGCNVWIEETED